MNGGLRAGTDYGSDRRLSATKRRSERENALPVESESGRDWSPSGEPSRWETPVPASAMATEPEQPVGVAAFPASPGPIVSAAGPASDSAASLPQRRSASDVRAMQVHDAYLVVETEEGLTVVDQHALHERILYEQLRNRVLAGSLESQRLLVPLPVELSASEAALLIEHSAILGQCGLGLQEFGTGTVLVTAYPRMLWRSEPSRIVHDVAEQLAESGKNPSRRDLLDSLLHMLSCKAAVKAGQRLAPEEIDSLLAQRHLIDDAHHCPHGRPTALVLSRLELDRQFGRLG